MRRAVLAYPDVTKRTFVLRQYSPEDATVDLRIPRNGSAQAFDLDEVDAVPGYGERIHVVDAVVFRRPAVIRDDYPGR